MIPGKLLLQKIFDFCHENAKATAQ